jgi:ABC-type glycerol-3-phosphate transport system permease component
MTSVVEVPQAAPGARGRRANGRVIARQARASRRLRSKHREAVTRSVLTYVLLTAGGVILLIPFVWLISTSLKPPTEVYSFPIVWIPHPAVWDNYLQVFQQSPFARYLLNTAIITSIGVIASLSGSSIAAYAFARMEFRGRGVMFGVMLATLMVPIWTVLIPTYIFFEKIGWLNTYLPILVPAFFATPFNTFLMRQFFLTIPLELEEAARVDGASRWYTFVRIILPLARPALLIISIFAFFYYWNEFLLPLLYIQSQNLLPVSVGVSNFVASQQVNFPLEMAASAIALAPPLILFFVFQRWFIQGIVVSGVKG